MHLPVLCPDRTAELVPAQSLDLDRHGGVTTVEVVGLMQQLLAPLIRSGEVCWAEPSNWGSDLRFTLRPNNGAVLQVALTPGSREDLNLTVSGYIRVGQEVDGQWLPLLSAKVLSADDAGRIAGELLTLFSRAFIW